MDVLDLKPSADGNPLPNTADTICRANAASISYNDFFWNYMKQNKPIILTNISEHWECRLNWTIPNDDGSERTKINFDYLRQKIPNIKVPVADCNSKYFNSHSKEEIDFYDFLQYWQQKSESEERNKLNDEAPTNFNKNFYLKDWHLRAAMPNYEFYKVPMHFASDWLNEKLISQDSDDYCFVYFGPKGTWTPFHTDVFGSYSWSTNIVGCKKWLLLAPGEEEKLADQLNNLPFQIDEQLLNNKKVSYLTIYQQENEALFVPSGWYHQVWNTSNTISVNHNWFNSCNIKQVWQNMCRNMQQVISEIEDCKQMDNYEQHCQIMLRSCFGMNYFEFLDLLEFVAGKRLELVDNENNIADKTTNLNNNMNTNSDLKSSCQRIFTNYALNEYHIHYDLSSINAVLLEMLEESFIGSSKENILYQRCQELVKKTEGF